MLRRLRGMVLAVAFAAFVFAGAGVALAGTISGEVASASNPGDPLPSVIVEVYDGATLVTSTFTNMLGMYSCEVPDGVYAVRFDPSVHNGALGTHFVASWYWDTFDQATAIPVFIDEFNPVAYASILLHKSPSVSGTLTSAVNGDVLDGVDVSIRDASDVEVAAAVTDATGFFSAQGLAPGQYTILFDPTAYNTANPDKPYYLGLPASGMPTVIDLSYDTDTDVTQSLEALRIFGNANGWGLSIFSGVDVDLWDAGGLVATATLEAGTYEFYPRPGTYKVRFDPARANADHPLSTPLAPVWWFSALTSDTALPLALNAGNRTMQADAYFYSKFLTLTAINALDGPIQGATVRLHDTTGVETTSAVTDIDGVATFNPAPDGTIYAKLDLASYNTANGTELADQWYSGKKTFLTADGFAVPYGTSNQLDFQVLPPSKIGGTITSAVNGDALEGVAVSIRDTSNSEVATAVTDATGHFVTPGLATGQHTVLFDATGYNDAHPDKPYYLGLPSSMIPTVVDLVPGADADVTQSLEALRLFGYANGWGGALNSGVDVGLWDAEGLVATTTVVGSYYEFYPRPGTYQVHFDPTRANADNWMSTPLAPAWYASALTSQTAQELSLNAGNRDVRADAYMDYKYLAFVANNVMTGVMPGATVRLYDDMGVETTSCLADIDGIARFSPAPDGMIYAKLDLAAYNLANGTELPDEWYSDKKTFDTADGFPISYGMTSQITFDVWPPSKIGGTVTDHLGDPAADVDVVISSFDGEFLSTAATATTGADGSYSATVVPYGQYLVYFDTFRHNTLHDTDVRSAFWSNGGGVVDPNLAGWVSADPGTTTDASVQLSGTMSVAGHVTGRAGAPLSGISVVARPVPRADVTDEFLLQDIANAGTSTSTDAEGFYRLEFADNEWMLPSIEGVQLSFHPGSTGYLFEYWQNQSFEASADIIPLSLGTQATAEATLTAGGTIAGRVTSKSGVPIAGVGVFAKRVGDTMWMMMGFSDSNGDYLATGFTAGDYTLQFYPAGSNEIEQTYFDAAFWNDRSTEASADVVTVPVETDLTGYDIQLTEAVGSIAGHVRDAAGQPIQGAHVIAYRYEIVYGELGEELQWVQLDLGITTDENGAYSFPRLHSGEFRLLYATPTPELASEWYDNKHQESLANTLTLGTGVALASLDATLDAVGHVTGTLTDELSGAPVNGAPVRVYAAGATGWDLVGTGGSDGAGYYDVAIPTDGPVRVLFGEDAETFGAIGTWYISEFHSNASTITAAADVPAGLGTSATVDASLTPAATIGGNVAYNRLLGNVSVEALRDDGAGWRVVKSYVMESGWGGGPEGNPGDIDGDGTPDFIDLDRDGDGIPNNLDPDPDTPDLFNGRYEMKGLKPGDYKVRFVDASGYYVPQYFDAARLLSSATTVTLAPAETRSAIDATMVAGSRILGRVNPPSLPESDGPPVYTNVAFYQLIDGVWHFGPQVSADLAGDFKVTGLETGTYALVAFVGESSDSGLRTYIPEQWNNAVAPGFDEANPAAFTPNAWATTLDVVEGEDVVLSEEIVLQKADVLDRRAPVSSTDAPTGWSNHDVVVHLSAIDAAGSPVGTYGGLGSSAILPRTVLPTITAEGDTTIRFYAEDAHDNREATRTATVRIDKTAPKTLDDHLPAYAETAFVRMYGTDALSGPDETRYVLDGGAETIGGAVVTTETGPHELTYWSTDKAGNVETPKTVTFSVGGDLTAPYTTAIAPVGWQAPPVTVELLAVDDSSGVAHTYYSTDGSVPSLVYTGPIEITATGNHLVKYRSIDVAGNTEALRFAAVWVDGTKPVTTSSVTTGSATANVMLAATDTVTGVSGSGVASTRYRIDGGAERVGTTAAVSGEGTHTVQFWSVDRVGNAESAKSTTFLIGDGVVDLPGTVSRVAGADRFAVAAELAKKGWNQGGVWAGVDDVIIANGEPGKEADPLAAAGLAGIYNAPLLLVRANSLPASTRDVIKAIRAKNPTLKVHIVGGAGSVSDGVWRSIKALGVTTAKDRISGADRYAVTAEIAKRMVRDLPAGDTIPGVLIVNAENPAAFYDALAASPAAYSEHLPMLGVRAGSVPPSVQAVLNSTLAGKSRYVVSAPRYVSAGVYSRLAAGERFTQSTSVYTAATDIAKELVEHDWASTADEGLAAKLPDALAGGTFLGKRGGVMLVTNSTATMQPVTQNYITATGAGVDNGWVIGGTGSVTSAVETKFRQLVQ